MIKSTPSGAAAPFPWLLADIGGSNARFAWVAEQGQAPQHVRTLAVGEHPSLVGAAKAYMNGLVLSGAVPAGRRPASAALAVATAVDRDPIRFTNSAWSFARSDLVSQLGVESLQVLNDFEALALSLPRLRATQWQAFGGAAPRFDAPLAVVGPGTGLGVAGLMPHGAGWVPVPGEGGHATLAPADDFESELLRVARKEHAHVSAERFLSGIGLPLLYRCCALVRGEHAVQGVDARWLVERALADDDACAVATIDQFLAMLGGFCGSVALMYGARGGVFIGGGIVPRLAGRLPGSAFRQRFEAKGRFSDFLRDVPTPLLVDTLAALDGAAQALEQAR